MLLQSSLEMTGCQNRIAMCPTYRFRDQAINNMGCKYLSGADAHCFSRVVGVGVIPPQNGCRRLRCSYGINAVRKHEQAISNTNTKSSTASPFTNDHRYDRNWKPCHESQV